MLHNFTFIFLTSFFISACSPKTGTVGVSPAGKSEVLFWKEVNNSTLTSSCKRILPVKYTLFETDYSGLRKLLLRSGNKPGAVNLDTILIRIPIPNNGFEDYALTQVQVLPPELSDKYPEIKTYQGRSLVFPEDIIRLDISPNGVNSMILSTRGTIIMDPLCPDDSVHVITYFKKDLPEGAKEPFEK